MRTLACAVPRREAQRVHQKLVALGSLSEEYETRRDGDWVYFPLKQGVDDATLRIVEVDLEPRKTRPDSYEELLDLPERLAHLLPGGYDVVGDMVIVRLPEELFTVKGKVGRALLEFVPGCRVVAQDQGVHGESRLRTLEIIAGTGPLSSLYVENGIRFRVDLSMAYFSPRLSGEHRKVAEAARDGERMLDLFSGIGPFSMTFLAHHPHSTAVAVDSNPQAMDLLRENALRLNIASRLECVEEDAASFLESGKTFDRVVMNLPHEGYKYLGLVGGHVKSPGWLHFYGIVPREKGRRVSSDGIPPFHAKGEEILSSLGSGGSSSGWSLKEAREVHPYSPSASLVSFTVEKR